MAKVAKRNLLQPHTEQEAGHKHGRQLLPKLCVCEHRKTCVSGTDANAQPHTLKNKTNEKFLACVQPTC